MTALKELTSLTLMILILTSPTAYGAEKAYVFCEGRPTVPYYSTPWGNTSLGNLSCGQEVTAVSKQTVYTKIAVEQETGYVLSHFLQDTATATIQAETMPGLPAINAHNNSDSVRKSGGGFWNKLAIGLAAGAVITASAYAASNSTYTPPSQSAYQSHSSSTFSYVNDTTGDNKDEYLGQLSVNPFATNSTGNHYSTYGSPYSANSINNRFGTYGNPYSSQSVSNGFAINAPKLYDSEGQYRGKLSSNPYDPDSISNPFGRYGSKFSSDSINNPFGAGSQFKSDSPNNPFGSGWSIFADKH